MNNVVKIKFNSYFQRLEIELELDTDPLFYQEEAVGFKPGVLQRKKSGQYTIEVKINNIRRLHVYVEDESNWRVYIELRNPCSFRKKYGENLESGCKSLFNMVCELNQVSFFKNYWNLN